MSSDIKFSKKNKRVISPFIVRESLYDYMTGNIEADIRPQVEEAIKYDKEIQAELSHLNAAKDYVESLSQLRVEAKLVDDLIEQSGIVSEISQKVAFERWPQSLKWGLEAVAVIAVMVSLLTVLPLEKVSQYLQQRNPQIILAEIQAQKDSSNIEISDESNQFVDEGATLPPVAATPTPSKNESPLEQNAGKTTKTPPEQKAEMESPPATATEPAKTAKVETAEEPKTAVTTGVLYRGALAVTNVEVIGPKITEKITTLGGRKAGSVELGWKRTPNSVYYHFTIPEAKYEDLVSFLATYGSPKIQKEKHPRVMPDGIIRLIITVEEATQ